jgi:hypothetical protein
MKPWLEGLRCPKCGRTSLEFMEPCLRYHSFPVIDGELGDYLYDTPDEVRPPGVPGRLACTNETCLEIWDVPVDLFEKEPGERVLAEAMCGCKVVERIGGRPFVEPCELHQVTCSICGMAAGKDFHRDRDNRPVCDGCWDERMR